MKRLILAFFILNNFYYAKDLVSKIEVQNKPPYVNNKNLVVASYPDSKITVTLNAVDPEGKGVYTILKNKNIGDGIECEVKNAIQIICKIPAMKLTKNDKCSVNTVNGKDEISYCKPYKILYYLKDGGYNDLPPETSETYTITLRVANEINATTKMDYRGYGTSLIGNFAVSNYNKNNIANILPKNMKEQYKLALNTKDKAKLKNDKILSVQGAQGALKQAVSGTDSDYILDKADSITTGTAVSSAPVYCTIKRAGTFDTTAYVCSLDGMLEVNPVLATTYSYDPADSGSEKEALSQCQESCKEPVQCNDISGDVFYNFVKDKNYITSDIANSNASEDCSEIKKIVIEKKNAQGELLSTEEIPVDSNVQLKDFYWNTDKLKTQHYIQDNLELDCDFRNKLDIKTYTKGQAFYVEPVSTCYLKYGGNEYPKVNDSNLYSFKLLYYQPKFTCPISNDTMVYNDKNICEQNCYNEGKCISINSALNNFNEHIINNCQDVILTNGEKLSEAVAAKQCKLVDEVSLDDEGNVKKYFVKNTAVVDPLRDDLGFSSDSSILKKENAIEMLGSFVDMKLKGKDEKRISKIVYPDKLIGFDGKEKNRGFDYLTSIYKAKDSNASVALLIKTSPEILNELRDRKYEDADYGILPVVMLLNVQKYGEKETSLKTYYLLNLDDYNKSAVSNSTVTQKKAGKYKVVLGKIGSNYWTGYCKIYNLTTKFYIKNLDDVEYFTLKRMKWDDWIKLTINGHLIKIAPRDGDRLEIVNKRVQYAPGKYGDCELSTSWDRKYNIEAKQFLKEGLNEVNITVEVAGKGEGYAEFETFVHDTETFECKADYCSKETISINTENASKNINISLSAPRVINQFYYLRKEAVIQSGGENINPDNLLFKLSDSSWGVTPVGAIENEDFLKESGLRYVIVNNDMYLNHYAKKGNEHYIIIPFDKSVIGVTTFDKMKQSYENYKADKENYFEKDADFNKYSISMDTSFKVVNSYESTANLFLDNNIKYNGHHVILEQNYLFLDENYDGIPDTVGSCPADFTKKGDYCYTELNSVTYGKASGLVPVYQVAGKGYNPDNLKITDAFDKWAISTSKLDLSSYPKIVNLWRSAGMDGVFSQWLAKIDFNSFDDGKLFVIIDKKKNLQKLINDVKDKGINYLVNLLENDYVDNKKYLAWEMNKRYSNSIIYNGNGLYKGFESSKVNRFIKLFGMHTYDTICPEYFVFDGLLCVSHKNQNVITAAGFSNYFTNMLEKKDGPLYASFNKGALFLRMVPENGLQPQQTNLVCPDGYDFDKNLKQCIKYADLDECDAPNGSYNFELQACTASATCSNGGVFDGSTGKCVKLTPSNFTGKNGYYFIFEDSKDKYSFYTPLTTPQKYQCIFQQYKCPLNGIVYNSKSKCDLLCYEYDNTGKKNYQKCTFVKKEEKDYYNDEETCRYKCKTEDKGYKGYFKLKIFSKAPFNKFSNISVYHNGNLVKNINANSDNSTLGVVIDNAKSGDEVKIKISSVWKDGQYVTGIGYWNDLVGDKTEAVGDKKCYLFEKYYDTQNKITIGIDIDDDGNLDSYLKIPTFYCVSETPFEKTIDIKLTDSKIQTDYYTYNLQYKQESSKIEFNNEGLCVTAEDKDNKSIVPLYSTIVNKEFTSNAKVGYISPVFADNSYYGVKGDVDKGVVLEFKKHLCHYPLQDEYEGAKYTDSLQNLFYLYKYFDQCPGYLEDGVKFLRLNTNEEKKGAYKLGIEKINKGEFNFDSYSPKEIYDALNKKHLIPFPSGKGIYMEDNYYIKIPNVGKRPITIGYGYSPFEDCKSINGTSVKSEIAYAPKTDCSYPGQWTYDSKINKCVANASDEFGCIIGSYSNGKCYLEPKCPSGYAPSLEGKCKKIIITKYQSDKKICKPWWTLRRKYICDNIEGLIDGYTFGLPRWITIKQLPVYKYQDYNFNKE
ncbi:hypothetical protein [Caminibacter sp.]